MQLFMILLCGDIGASNSRLAIIEVEKQKIHFVSKEFLKNSEFSDFHQTLHHFKKKHSLKIDGACFGVAGPVENGRVQITNLPWNMSELEIAHFLEIKSAYLINDLEGIAYGISSLDKSDCKEILPGRTSLGTRAVIAPGSGIGEAILFWDGKSHRPMPTEGGHCSYSPTSPIQLELLEYLFKRYSHVSWERVLSGPGLLNIYEFLRDTQKATEKLSIQSSSQISEGALNQSDPLCLKAVELFFEILATEAGNLALKCLPAGGLYIAGGITPKLLKLLDKKAFAKCFYHKGRMNEILKNFSVTLILSEDVGIRGAAKYFLERSGF
jgi:glucokinase